jgi:hypothetical protein
MNGSEHLPEGVRIPRIHIEHSYSFDDCIACSKADDHAINDEQDEYAAHRRLQGLIDRLNEHGIHATERHQGVLLTEDAARAVLARLEEGK